MPRPPKLNPRSAAEQTIAEMNRRADSDTAASCQRYFKQPVAMYGLGSAVSKALLGDLVARVRPSWKLRDAVAYCNALVRDSHLEPRGHGFQVVAAFVAEAGPGLSRQIRRWLERSCGNWALVDNLAPSVLTPLIERHPGIVPEVVGWTGSRNMWLRRGAVVAFVPLVRHGRHLDTAYEIAARLLGDGEDLMHKALGWMLREAGKTDVKRLERFLRAEGPRIPRTTVRYAIERFPKERRKRLLEATR